MTAYGYDYRDRRTSMTPPVGATQAYTLDNQDRVVQTDWNDPATGTLVGRTATKYDGQRRA